HGHGRITGVGDEAALRCRGERDAVRARGIGNVAQHLPSRSIEHYDVGAARDEDAAGTGFSRQVVRASFATDVELLDPERLRSPRAWRGQDNGDEEGRYRSEEHTSELQS